MAFADEGIEVGASLAGGWASRSPEGGGTHTRHHRASSLHDATLAVGFACPPDLALFCRSDQLGLEVAGQPTNAANPDRMMLACRLVEPRPR